MNRERWLLVASLVMFIGVVVYYLPSGWVTNLIGRKAITLSAKPSPPQPAPPGAADSTLPQVSVKVEAVDAETPWGRNPFLTEAEEAAKGKSGGGEGLQVKAIIVGRPKSVATIDGRTVTVGEMVGEETVREIRPDAVMLEKDGRKRLVKISEPNVSIEVKEKKK